MKNLTNRFVSFMLVFALALSLSAPAFAAEYSGTNELNNEVGTIDALEEIDFFVVEQEETSEDVLREIYANLAPEAKEKALQVIASNPDSHRPNISSVISGYKQPSKSAQSIEITGFIEKSKPSQIIFLYTLLPLTA